MTNQGKYQLRKYNCGLNKEPMIPWLNVDTLNSLNSLNGLVKALHTITWMAISRQHNTVMWSLIALNEFLYELTVAQVLAYINRVFWLNDIWLTELWPLIKKRWVLLYRPNVQYTFTLNYLPCRKSNHFT